MAHILGIDANSDLFTRYITAFREKLIFSGFPSWLGGFLRTAKWPHHSLHHFKGKTAVQPDIDNYLLANKVDYITAAGHGTADTFTGFNRTLIWKADQDFTYLRAPIVHFLSCQTGAVLGQQMVADGVRAHWGYTAKFQFLCDDPQPRDLTADSIAYVFIEMDCLIDSQILSGSTADKVYEAVTDYFKSAFYKLKNDPDGQAVLLNNYRHLVGPLTTHGDPSQTI
jgi:hypothetical protein